MLEGLRRSMMRAESIHVQISDFSKLSQVSVKALRYYDERGLLKPAQIDRYTATATTRLTSCPGSIASWPLKTWAITRTNRGLLTMDYHPINCEGCSSSNGPSCKNRLNRRAKCQRMMSSSKRSSHNGWPRFAVWFLRRPTKALSGQNWAPIWVNARSARPDRALPSTMIPNTRSATGTWKCASRSARRSRR